jgi:uroporphyrinogen decarboxylase
MNKREALLSLAAGEAPAYVPAGFFLHFDPQYHAGRAAVERHLAFFRATGMDVVKVQYEQTLTPAAPLPARPADWAKAPRYPAEFFEEPAAVARGLVEAARDEAVVMMTLYSPFMWARRWGGEAALMAHLKEDPEAVRPGLEAMTDNVIGLTRACRQAGVDGFYVSTQGGEAGRFTGTDIFEKHIQPTDLAVWEAVQDCAFNVLHVCDYEGPYDDLTPFLDYPGQLVNCSLKVGGREMSPREAAELFGRPFMGGMERLGVLARGTPEEARQAAEAVLREAPERFMLAADCTVPGDTPWENLRAAIEAAHGTSQR